MVTNQQPTLKWPGHPDWTSWDPASEAGEWACVTTTLPVGANMTGEQAQDAGIALAHCHLHVVQEAYGPDVAAAYAQGFACAARNQMIGSWGTREAYARMSAVADGVFEDQMPQGK